MNRRSFLKGLAGVGAALVLPPTLGENAEAARRFWALDQTMVGRGARASFVVIDEAAFIPFEYQYQYQEWVTYWALAKVAEPTIVDTVFFR